MSAKIRFRLIATHQNYYPNFLYCTFGNFEDPYGYCTAMAKLLSRKTFMVICVVFASVYVYICSYVYITSWGAPRTGLPFVLPMLGLCLLCF